MCDVYLNNCATEVGQRQPYNTGITYVSNPLPISRKKKSRIIGLIFGGFLMALLTTYASLQNGLISINYGCTDFCPTWVSYYKAFFLLIFLFQISSSIFICCKQRNRYLKPALNATFYAPVHSFWVTFIEIHLLVDSIFHWIMLHIRKIDRYIIFYRNTFLMLKVISNKLFTMNESSDHRLTVVHQIYLLKLFISMSFYSFNGVLAKLFLQWCSDVL